MSENRRHVHLICGSHWDREWRYTYEQSLIRLAEVLDATIDVCERRPDFRYHLDGGVVLLEDYARVRPAMADRLARLIQGGRVVLSPWYTLPEMFSVGGESTVRNMFYGQRVAEKWGLAPFPALSPEMVPVPFSRPVGKRGQAPISDKAPKSEPVPVFRETGTGTDFGQSTEIGASPLFQVGYTATGYGQLSQLPQLYAGFGIDTVLFYRGLNKYVAPPVFWWEGADGTRALDFRLFDDFTRSNFHFRVYRRLLINRKPDEGRHGEQPGRLFHPAGEATYEDEYRLLDAAPCAYTDDALRAAVDDLCDDAVRLLAVERHFLAVNEEDNACPGEPLLALIADLRRVCPDVNLHIETFADYIDFVRRTLGPERLARLPVLKGEMRYCDVDGFWGGLFAGAISARIDLKLANESAEHALVRRAEPLSLLAWILSSPSSHSSRPSHSSSPSHSSHSSPPLHSPQLGPLPDSAFEFPSERLETAWKALLENHAHDSINGTSMDQVHQDMEYRFDKARCIGEELATRALAHLTSAMGNTQEKGTGSDFGALSEIGACPLFQAGPQFLVGVVNATGHERSGPVTCVLDLPADGPTGAFDLIDPDGAPVDCQIEHVGPVRGRVHSPIVPGLRFFAERFRVTFQASDLPAVGWRCYRLRPKSVGEARADVRTLRCGPAAMENEFLRLEVRSDGSFDLLDKSTGRLFRRLNSFEDGGDAGHATACAAPRHDEVVTSLAGRARVVVEEDGGLRATLRVELAMSVPEELELDAASRSVARVDLPITTRLTLRKGVPFVEIETEFENRAFCHRLRAVFPTGLAAATHSTAAVPFDVVRRPIALPDSSGWKEAAYPTHPMDAFVDVCDGATGFALFPQGLKEYEVTDSADRRLAITLLRAPLEGMAVHAPQTRAELRRHAGRHMLGRHVVRYALMPHAGDWQSAALFLRASDFRTAPEIIQFQISEKGVGYLFANSAVDSAVAGASSGGVQNKRHPTPFLLRLGPEELVLSALKKAEDREGVIVRLWNPTAQALDATLTVGVPIREAHLCRLDETRLDPLPLADGAVRLAAGAKKILTIELVM